MLCKFCSRACTSMGVARLKRPVNRLPSVIFVFLTDMMYIME